MKKSQRIARVLRGAFLFGFIAILASCPTGRMTPQDPTADAVADQPGVIELESVILSAGESRAALNTTIQSYRWRQFRGPSVALSNADGSRTGFVAPFVSEATDFEFSLTVVASNGLTDTATVRVRVSPSSNADADEDGLLEIDTLEMLHNMRYNLAGTSYKSSETATGDSSGCPTAVCTGYELTHNLNFDGDEDGGTWTGNSATGFTLDTGDDNDTYFNIGEGGWDPIGSNIAEFTATFEGNGNTITNLAIKRSSGVDVGGLFGYIDTGAIIRNIGLVNSLVDYSGNSAGDISIAGLVGRQVEGSVIASYVTGTVNGGTGTGSDGDNVAALVGLQEGGSIVASYAKASVYGNAGNSNTIGVLLGRQKNGAVVASYATGSATGGTGAADQVGGLIGWQEDGSVSASYANVAVSSGAGGANFAGGLVGNQQAGTIVASYALGNSMGGDGANNKIGILLGANEGTLSVSYGFGTATGGGSSDTIDTTVGAPGSLALISLVATATSAGTQWDNADLNSLGAWDFGTNDQSPILKYADYDGSRTGYNCDMFPDPDSRVGGNLCGDTIPGQGR